MSPTTMAARMAVRMPTSSPSGFGGAIVAQTDGFRPLLVHDVTVTGDQRTDQQ
jgi:hypothetical protein